MVESNRKDNTNNESTLEKPIHSIRSKKNIDWMPFLLFIIFIIGASLILIYPHNYTQSIESPSSVAPPSILNTFITEFNDQSIPVKCRAYDYNNDRIEWNGTIEIVKVESEFDYITNSNNRLIIPEFYAFLNTDLDRHYRYDNTECMADGKFFYNLTISGKTITNSFYIRPEDCNKIRDCGITEKLKEIIN